MRASYFALVLMTLSLGSSVGCSQPTPYDLRRFSFSGQPVGELEAGGVARPAIKLKSDSISLELSDLTSGRVSLHVAPPADLESEAGVDVSLRETGWRAWLPSAVAQRCSVRWGEPGTPADAPWRACIFELPRAVGSARLEVQRRGDRAGEVLLSEVRVEGDASRHLPDVYILLLDAARADGFRPFRPDAPVGANLELLARDSITLRNLHSSSSWTRPAVATLFTGLRADRHRVVDRTDVLGEDARTLAEILKARGYSSAGWSTNPNVLPMWGFAQGFDAFVDQGAAFWGLAKTDGATVVSRVRAALASRGAEPVFYYAHLMDPHAPYVPSADQLKAITAHPDIKSHFPRPLAIMSAPTDYEAFLSYTGELLDADEHVGAFVQVLKDAGVYEDAAIVVVSDHGEEFLDHGGRDHGRTLYEEVLRIPALIKLPGNRSGGRVVEESVSLVDVFPTLLGVLGLDMPPSLDGQPIDLSGATNATTRPHVATLALDGRSQSTILDPPWKLIRNDVLHHVELFNLEEDPVERQNKVVWHQDVASRLTKELDLILSHGQEGWHILFCGTLEEATIEVVLGPSVSSVKSFGLEAGEAVEQPGKPGTWLVQPTLTPTLVKRAVFGKLTEVQVPEHAELIVAAQVGAEGSRLEIRSVAGCTFDARLGESSASVPTTELVLDSASESLAAVFGGSMDCVPAPKPGSKPEPATRPFLRAWYVPALRAAPTEAMDPVMEERLRALGYVE